MDKPIGEKIYELRKARTLTQEQLGEKLGVSGQAVSKWEKGESMPDILSLPALCDILGVSADALLGLPAPLRQKNAVRDFCEYAEENGVTESLLGALARLFYLPPNQNGHFAENSALRLSPRGLRVYDRAGMGFLLADENAMAACLETDSENAAFYLKKLADESFLALLRRTSLTSAVTLEELASATGREKEAVMTDVFSLMKRNLLVCDVDESGKRGYMQGTGMAGVYMILAGCRTLCRGGALQGNVWFTRSDRE